MAKHPNLYRRQAVYWWRRRIPKNLRQFFSTSEIRVSLRAHIVAEAATRGARLRSRYRPRFPGAGASCDERIEPARSDLRPAGEPARADELDRCERERELAGARTEADIQQSVLDHQRRRARPQQALRYNAYEELEQQLMPAVASV